MLATVRMYRHADLDLLFAYGMYGNKFSAIIRDCLRAFVRQANVFAFPNMSTGFIPDASAVTQMKTMNIVLDDRMDADIIAVLQNIRQGYRNNFIKNVVRMYIGPSCVAAYAATRKGYDFLYATGRTMMNANVAQPINFFAQGNSMSALSPQLNEIPVIPSFLQATPSEKKAKSKKTRQDLAKEPLEPVEEEEILLNPKPIEELSQNALELKQLEQEIREEAESQEADFLMDENDEEEMELFSMFNNLIQ